MSVVAAVPTSARYRRFSSSARKLLSTRPLSRKSWATPVNTPRVLASPCLMFLKRGPKSIGTSTTRNPVSAKKPGQRSTSSQLTKAGQLLGRDAAGADGPPQLVGPVAVAAAGDGQAKLRRQGPQLLDAAGTKTWIGDFQGAEAKDAKLRHTLFSAIIGRVRPGRNAARAADEGDGFGDRQAHLGHGHAPA